MEYGLYKNLCLCCMLVSSDVAFWCVSKRERRHAIIKLEFRFCNYVPVYVLEV